MVRSCAASAGAANSVRTKLASRTLSLAYRPALSTSGEWCSERSISSADLLSLNINDAAEFSASTRACIWLAWIRLNRSIKKLLMTIITATNPSATTSVI